MTAPSPDKPLARVIPSHQKFQIHGGGPIPQRLMRGHKKHWHNGLHWFGMDCIATDYYAAILSDPEVIAWLAKKGKG